MKRLDKQCCSGSYQLFMDADLCIRAARLWSLSVVLCKLSLD